MNASIVQPEAAIDREMAVLMLDAAKAVSRGPCLRSRLSFGPYRIRAIRMDASVQVQVSEIRNGVLVRAEIDSKDLLTPTD